MRARADSTLQLLTCHAHCSRPRVALRQAMRCPRQLWCACCMALFSTLVLSTVAVPDLSHNVRVVLSPTAAADPTRPFAIRTAGIIKRVITSRCNASVELPAAAAAAAAPRPSASTVVVELSIDASLGEERYSVRANASAPASVTITGGDVRGLLFGAGRFLRTSQYDGPPAAPFTPSTWRGADAPRLPGSFRAAYFAVHYDNFYAAAPVSDVAAYVEDIALWGVNTLIVLLPGPSAFARGERTTAPDAPQLPQLRNRTRVLLQLAARIGLSPGVIVVPNQGFDNGTQAHRQGHSPVPYADPTPSCERCGLLYNMLGTKTESDTRARMAWRVRAFV